MLTFVLLTSLFVSSFLVVVAYAFRRAPTTDAFNYYFLADRKIARSAFMSTLTASNAALANIMFLYAYWGYRYGFAAVVWGSAFWIVGFAVFLFFYFRSRFATITGPNSPGLGFNEICGRLAKSHALTIAVAFGSAVTFLFLMALEIGVGANAVYVAFTGIDPANTPFNPLPGFALAFFIAMYCFRGGFPMVVGTDMYQTIFILGSLFAIMLAADDVLRSHGTHLGLLLATRIATDRLFAFDWNLAPFVLGSLFSWGFWFICTMDSWQRTIAVSSESSSKQGPNQTSGVSVTFVTFGVILLVVVSSVSAVVGMTVQYVLKAPFPPPFPVINFIQLAFIEAESNAVAAIVLAAILAGFISAMASTVDTYTVVVTQSVCDIYYGFKRRFLSDIDANKQLAVLRRIEYVAFAVPIVSFLFYVLATRFGRQDNFTLYMLAGSLPLALLPTALTVLCGRDDFVQRMAMPNTVGIFVAIVISLTMNFYLATTALTTFNPIFFGLLYFSPLVTALIAAIPMTIAHIAAGDRIKSQSPISQ